MMKNALLLTLALLLAASGLADDLVVFVNGDRLSGKIVATGTKRIRLRTPYGRLEIPRTEVERLVWEDGREEILTAAAAPAAPTSPKTTADLTIVVTGHSFWQAWHPKNAPSDPSLRLVLRLDDREAIAYTDANLDPDDLPGAVVNSFVFDPERLFVSPGDGVKARPPEAGSKGVQLPLELEEPLGGQRQIELAYQVNDGTSSYPEWRDVVKASASVDLSLGKPMQVSLEQDRGLMEYSDRYMHYVETFRALARVAPASP